MGDESTGFPEDDAIDMGYLSLPAEVQAAVEEAAARAKVAPSALNPDGHRFLAGVHHSWHAIEAAQDRFGDPLHAGAVCGAVVRPAVSRDDESRPQPYDVASFPVSLDPCPACRWVVAARTGTLEAALAALSDPLAHDVAAAVLAEAARDEREPDDPMTMQLLTAVSRHAPVALVSEGCSEGDCDHEGDCPSSSACRACSLQAGSWAGEWEGQYMAECRIPAPCAPLLALTAHYEVKS